MSDEDWIDVDLDGWETNWNEQLVGQCRKVHENDEETRVAVVDVGSSFAEGGTFLIIAVDLDVEGEVIDADLVGTTLTGDEAEKRASRWMETNPKGLGGEKSGLGALLGG